MSGSQRALAALLMGQAGNGASSDWLSGFNTPYGGPDAPAGPPSYFFTPPAAPLMGAGPRGMPAISERRMTEPVAPTLESGEPQFPYNGAAAETDRQIGLLGPGAAFQEDFFQRRIKNTPWYGEFTAQYGEAPDLNTPDYDYRAAMNAGVRPQRDPYDPTQTEALNQAAFGLQPQGRYHWPSSVEGGDMLKAADHKTAWKEHFMRLYGADPDSLPREQVDQMMRGAAYKPPQTFQGLLK